MCGIAGVISRHPDEKARAGVERMTAALRHRGPDSGGFVDDPPVVLGVRRLAIIDVEHGDQPLYSEDRQVVAIANCEIYNYVELRSELMQRGHVFATQSDAEVIVHLYEEHGTRFVEHLRGMFAIALWDARRRRLLLARDRMGEKPLYLYESKDAIYFASEMKSLLASGSPRFELDAGAVQRFVYYSFIPEPQTAVRGIRKLPAATWMTVDAATLEIEERRYWNMEEAPPLDVDPAAAVRERLEEIAKIVIRSDVPVGIALSGGLDSTAIASILAKNGFRPRCISAGYAGEPENDESRYAEQTAAALGLPFTRVELHTRDVTAAFADLVARQDDPIADIAGAAYGAVAWAAHETGTKVLLQGQGGDELFFGYPWVAEAVRQTARKARLRGGDRSDRYMQLRGPDARGLRIWAGSLAGLRSGWNERRRDRTSGREQLVFYDLTPHYAAAERIAPRLFAPATEAVNPAEVFTRPFDGEHPEIAITDLICETYLRCNGLAQADRLAMSYSVESRNPLLDHRLVETVIGLRKARPDHELPPKSWLREAVKDLVPAAVVARPKRGFRPPAAEWRRQLFAAHGGKLRDGFLAHSGIFNRAALASLAAPRGRQTMIAFPLLVLEEWCRVMSRA